MKLPKILKQPNLPSNLPSTAKWLSGEGAGSWFVFEEVASSCTIIRYSPKGNFECENNFEKPFIFNLSEEFTMSYPSHCSVITVLQNGEKIRLTALTK